MKGTKKLVKILSNKFYPPSVYKDDNKIFYEWISSCLKLNYIILDCGAGSGLLNPHNFKGYCKEVVGIDLDKRILKNPFLNKAYIGDFVETPFSDQSFDIIFANNVIEHVTDPIKFLKEMKRILKTNGLLFIKTPNKWHYVGILSSLTPYRFHRFYNKLRGVKKEDIFPTVYGMNQILKIKNLRKKMNFNYEIKYFEGRPEYLTLNPLIFLIGIIYEKIFNFFSFLKIFRSVIILKITF